MRAKKNIVISLKEQPTALVLRRIGVFLYANERLAQLCGYSVVESIRKPFIDFFAPEEVPKVLDHYNRRMAGEKVPPIYETALKCKDGSRLDVEVNAGIINYKGKKARSCLYKRYHRA